LVYTGSTRINKADLHPKELYAMHLSSKIPSLFQNAPPPQLLHGQLVVPQGCKSVSHEKGKENPNKSVTYLATEVP
jgi:hypothetical protein